MTIVIDANVLLRFVDVTAGQHTTAVNALTSLRSRGEALRTLPQSIYEFWTVATRPVANNGLGLTPAECARESAAIEVLFPVLADPPGLFAEWRALVVALGCQGKVCHDARYAAALRALGLAHLLTFNTADFTRFPGLTAIDPATVTPAPTTPAGPSPPATP